MADPLNTHSYDGKIDILQLPDLITVGQLSFEEKRERGFQLIDNAVGKINTIAISYLNGIIKDIGTQANVDPTNNLVADDLICICWVYRENVEFMSMLEIQLMDMATGFCPQGRTHRLFQILVAFI